MLVGLCRDQKTAEYNFGTRTVVNNSLCYRVIKIPVSQSQMVEIQKLFVVIVLHMITYSYQFVLSFYSNLCSIKSDG